MNDLTFSITIPCLNEEKYIGKCLQSIVDCTYPKHLLFVFVSDGRSTDNTRNIITEYSAKHPFITLIDNPDRITPIALNLGIKASDADVRIILGAHSEIAPDYIEQCVEVFNTYKDVACAGGIIDNVMDDETSEVIALGMSSSFGVGNAHFRTGEKDGYVDTVAFGAYRKEVFEQIGYFDEDLARNQDDEFNFRLLKAGMKIYLSKKIRSKYYVRASFKNLKRQYFQYGYWKVYVNKKHKAITTLRQLVPAVFVLFLLTGYLPAIIFFPLIFLYLFGIAAYLGGAWFAASAKSSSIGTRFRIMKVFFYLHWFYGTGYIEGLYHFFILGKKPSSGKSTLSR